MNDDNASVDSQMAALEPSRPRFCGLCGHALDVATLACPGCIAATQTARPTSAQRIRPSAAAGTFKSAMLLYAAFLATLTITFFNAAVEYQMAMAAIDAAVVVGWSIYHWRLIWPQLRLPRGIMWYVGPILGGGVTFVLATALVSAVAYGLNVEELWMTPPFIDGGYGWAAVILFCCVQPAVIEELAFRGVILGAFERVLTRNEAIVVTALMFMVMHLALLGFPHLFLLGLVLGWMRVRSGSLAPCMLLHFTHNLLCVLSEPWLMQTWWWNILS